jgi:dTDP-4-amino-4,6-dideoxygalactose transaminase
MQAIPPVDLQKQYAQIQAEADAAVLAVLHSGRYIGGTVVTDFERDFGVYVGTPHNVACNSGTDALYLALRALNIGSGDEVIVPTFTFIATAETVSAVGAKPVFVDMDPQTFNFDLDQVARAITPQTKAIIPVHLFGCPVDMDRLMTLAPSRNLFVIEDCAQATGAMWGDRQVGAIGDVGCFSFFPTKNLGGCGDGGMATTHNPDLAEKMRVIREHGSKVRYQHEAIGINSRLDAVQAAILGVKLPYLDRWNEQRAAIAQGYTDRLAGIPGITLPQAPQGGRHVWNQYTIQVRQGRDRLRQHLQDQGILSMVYYPCPLHLQPVYLAIGGGKGSLPQAETAMETVLSLPMFPDLTPEEQDRVAQAIRQWAALPVA